MTWEPMEPPKNLDVKVKEMIHKKLHPTFANTMTKLGMIHLVMGPLTLLICPQFDLSPLSHSGLAHYYMSLGIIPCTIACGMTYVVFTLLLAVLLSSPEEIKLVRKSKLGLVLLISGLSLGFFVAFGAQIFATLTLWWLLGAAGGSLLTLELGWKLRQGLA